MTREEKEVIINTIAEKLQKYPNFYITDTSNLPSDKTSSLGASALGKGVAIYVAKNSLIRKLWRSRVTLLTSRCLKR